MDRLETELDRLKDQLCVLKLFLDPVFVTIQIEMEAVHVQLRLALMQLSAIV
jgi:hypothetical protein